MAEFTFPTKMKGIMKISQKDECRFLKYIKKTDSCWLWTGSKRNGYGEFEYNYKQYITHRFSYLLYKGEIPKKAYVCHTCDNPSCVNPDHLWLGTPRDNMQDKVNKNR